MTYFKGDSSYSLTRRTSTPHSSSCKQMQNSKLNLNKSTFVPNILSKGNSDKYITKPLANTNRVSVIKYKDGKVPVTPSTDKVKIGRPASLHQKSMLKQCQPRPVASWENITSQRE